MGEDEEDVFEDPDFDELEGALKADREEHREQVSFEWVETVRRAGELWRDVDDIETVAEEVDLSIETTKEALTVYRLIFENAPMAVASKAVTPGRSFFSLEDEVTTLDPEDESESVEDLLREFVGAVYLEYDIQEETVGEPPERETPPSWLEGVELDLDMSGLLPSFEIPSSSLAAVTNMPKIHDKVFQSQVSAVANAVSPDLFPTETMLASAIHPVVDQQMMAQSLVPLTPAIEEQQTLIGHSAALALSDAIPVPDIRFPESVLADLTAMQPSVGAAAAAGSYPSPSPSPSPAYEKEQSIVDEASEPSVEAEPLEATVETGSEFSPVGVTVDSTLPDTGTFTTELVVEVPVMVVEAMLSTGKARVWFSNLSKEHQLTAVRLLLASVAVYITGTLFAAPVAIIPAPSVRRAIVVEES